MTQTKSYEDEETGVYHVEYMETESNTQTISGTWAFIGGNDEDEFKNKERINLWYKEYDQTNTTKTEADYTDLDADDGFDYSTQSYTSETEEVVTEAGSGTNPDETWELVMLKNKEMEAVREYTSTYKSITETSHTSGNTTTSSDSEYTSTVTATTSMSMTQE